MNTNVYANWYFGNMKTHGFYSSTHFADIVGPRPSPDHSLARVGNPYGEPLTPENFVWVSKKSIAAAKRGELVPPRLTSEHTPEQQAVNDMRFAEHVKGIMVYAEKRKRTNMMREKWQTDLSQLMDMIESYVVERGYSASQAMDPNILPADEYPKLNQGRALANKLMRYLAGDYHKLSSIERLNQRNKEKARIEREQKMINNTNRVYTGKAGRPMEKFVKKRVRISDLTPEQRKAHNIPPGQDYTHVRNESGRNVRVWTVMVDVPNPKLQSVAA